MNIINPTTPALKPPTPSLLDEILCPFQMNRHRVQSVYKAIHNNKAITPYEGSSASKLPAFSNILFTPYEVFLGVGSIIQGNRENDFESLLDNTIRLLGAVFSFSGAFVAILAYQKLLELLPAGGFTYLPGIQAFGLSLCSIELALELINLQRTVKLRHTLHFDILKELRKGIAAPSSEEKQAYLKKICSMIQSRSVLMEFFEEYDKLNSRDLDHILRHLHQVIVIYGLSKIQSLYLHIPPHEIQKVVKNINKNSQNMDQEKKEKIRLKLDDILKGKKKNLSRRIGSWIVEELDIEIEGIYNNLLCSDVLVKENALIKAEEIMTNIDIQTKKKIITHVIGIIALTLTISAFILTLITPLSSMILILLILGGIFGMTRTLCYYGFFQTKGWTFSPSNLLPDFLQKAICDWNSYSKKKKELDKITYNNPTYMIGYQALPILKLPKTTIRPIHPDRVSV